MSCGLAEHLLGRQLAPALKQRLAARLSLLGLVLLVVGEALRKLAMVRCRDLWGPFATAGAAPCLNALNRELQPCKREALLATACFAIAAAPALLTGTHACAPRS